MQGTGLEQYIEFGIGNEHYAIRIQDIHEIIKLQDITEIPNVLPYVRGVINLRGKIVPVISLRGLFRLEDQQYTKQTRIIVVHQMEEKIGIVVDRVNKVTTFSDIQSPPERVGGNDGHLFTGIGLTKSGLVGILKMDEVLLHEQE
ncbi:chemotaxis protein CheW [Paenibacillus allorhizosphaerae]|uniref:Chemotaxis protein CheW n=1 Tax=Paenibacillus allorhizosphaerae TaxID=2849866 RepID=A0ABM8VIQ3_9BACL|nr:chemotaxis protein CheW [Paenibacillus allorhizosphaerae]CAG7644450.1 Chemotaxis protein CheW [Paenibacillus allorhizosphaerae]